jgi:hypothetical protein
VFKTTIRLFHYLFSQEVVGIAGMLLFIAAIVMLCRDRNPSPDQQPTSRQLAFLLAFPFVANCVLSLAAIYPFGGTRHDSYLAAFAMPGIAIGLTRWRVDRTWMKPAAFATALLFCNLFPSPTGQYIPLKDQKRGLMQNAVGFMQKNVPSGSMILADNQSGLLLSYYLCHDKAVALMPPFSYFSDEGCAGNQLVSLDPSMWMFRGATFSQDLQQLEQTYAAPGKKVWLFQAGWLIKQDNDFRTELPKFGCPSAKDFGKNIMICEITLPNQTVLRASRQ